MLCVPLWLALASGGCGFTHPVRHVPEGAWHATLGGPARAAYAGDTVPAAPREAWRERFERGQLSAPVIQAPLLILGSSGRVLTVASAENGSRYWARRFDGPIVGQPLRADSVLLVATASRRGRVMGVTVARGRRRWERRLGSPVTTEPVLAGGVLLAATVRQELHALDAGSGAERWRVRIPGQGMGAPVLDGGSLLLATQRDTLLRVALADGAILASVPLPGTPSAALALADSLLIIPLHPDRVAAFHARTLAPLWSIAVGEPVLAAPVIDGDAIYVLTRAADVWRIQRDGSARRIANLEGTARESLTVARNALLVGLLDGTVVMLARDGTELWREQYRSAIRSPVAVHGGQLFVTLHDGTVVNLR